MNPKLERLEELLEKYDYPAILYSSSAPILDNKWSYHLLRGEVTLNNRWQPGTFDSTWLPALNVGFLFEDSTSLDEETSQTNWGSIVHWIRL